MEMRKPPLRLPYNQGFKHIARRGAGLRGEAKGPWPRWGGLGALGAADWV